MNNSYSSVGNTTLSLTSSDISASRSRVDAYIVVLGTRETLLDVIDYASVDVVCRSRTPEISTTQIRQELPSWGR